MCWVGGDDNDSSGGELIRVCTNTVMKSRSHCGNLMIRLIAVWYVTPYSQRSPVAITVVDVEILYAMHVALARLCLGLLLFLV